MRYRLLKIHHDETGKFIERPNRFLGIVDTGNEVVKVHIRDPGRLEELLYEGNDVRIARASGKKRKTAWDLIAARYDDSWVLVNSGFHRDIAEKILHEPKLNPIGITEGWEAEKVLGRSRIDFFNSGEGRNIWLEVKGCTLAIDGKALFPDAPTLRGTKHLMELTELVDRGERAVVFILVFRDDAHSFAPFEGRDPDFARAFREAVEVGVKVYPIRLSYEDGHIYYRDMLKISH